MNDTERPRNAARAWISIAMAALAAVAAVISYSDGLFLVRLAGNTDWHAYLYPLLPDGLIVICLIALLAAGKRAAWPTFGLGLGIALTLAMNVAAGIAHSPLDAVVDGAVPVVFFVAVEVFIGYVRRGRVKPQAVPVAVPVKPRLPSAREIRQRQRCGPETEKKIRAELKAFARTQDPPAGAPPEAPPAPAGARDVPAGVQKDHPRPAPAGALPAMNGHHGA